MKIFKRCLVVALTLIACYFYLMYIEGLYENFDTSKIQKTEGVVTEYSSLPSTKIIKVYYNGSSYQFTVDSSYKIIGSDKGKPIDLYIYNGIVGLSENMVISNIYNMPFMYCGLILIVCIGFVVIAILEGTFKNE